MSVQVNNVVEDCHATSWSRNDRKGFTLVELLVVVAIIAILAVAGVVVFRGVTGGARDSARKADVDAMVNAYEVKANGGSYQPISDPDFSSGKKPKDPNPTKGDYFNYLAADGSGYKICAALDGNPNTYCNTSATNCYCKFSTQSTINPGSGVNQPGSTNYGSGPGGSTPLACDPNGTLLSGLVGYWQFDEDQWVGNPGEVKDSSGYNANGTAIRTLDVDDGLLHGANTSNLGLGKFNKAGDFSDPLGIVKFGIGEVPSIVNLRTFTLSAWVKLTTITSWNVIMATSTEYVGFQKYIAVNNGKVYGGVSCYPSASADSESHTGLNTGTWYLLTVTYDDYSGDKRSKIYINGIEESSYDYRTTCGGSMYSESNSFFFLGNNEPLGEYNGNVDGLVDDVRIYNRVLGPNEIKAFYNDTAGCVSAS